MSRSFDPYYSWLGIPKSFQPPNRYRLLGLRPGKGTPAEIEHCANQRIRLLTGLQYGQFQTTARKLLLDVMDAKYTLLDSQARKEYDETLLPTLSDSELTAPVAILPILPPKGADIRAVPPPMPPRKQLEQELAGQPPALPRPPRTWKRFFAVMLIYMIAFTALAAAGYAAVNLQWSEILFSIITDQPVNTPVKPVLPVAEPVKTTVPLLTNEHDPWKETTPAEVITSPEVTTPEVEPESVVSAPAVPAVPDNSNNPFAKKLQERVKASEQKSHSHNTASAEPNTPALAVVPVVPGQNTKYSFTPITKRPVPDLVGPEWLVGLRYTPNTPIDETEGGNEDDDPVSAFWKRPPREEFERNTVSNAGQSTIDDEDPDDDSDDLPQGKYRIAPGKPSAYNCKTCKDKGRIRCRYCEGRGYRVKWVTRHVVTADRRDCPHCYRGKIRCPDCNIYPY